MQDHAEFHLTENAVNKALVATLSQVRNEHTRSFRLEVKEIVMESGKPETQTDAGRNLDKKATVPPEVRGSHSEESSSAIGKTAEHIILIVDDESSILKALRRALAGENYCIHTAENSQEALDLILTNRFAVIISDFSMPGLSGADLLGIIKEKEPRCIRVMLTGATDAESVPHAIADGILHCQRFIIKPWDDDQIRLTIRECISEYEASCKEA